MCEYSLHVLILEALWKLDLTIEGQTGGGEDILARTEKEEKINLYHMGPD